MGSCFSVATAATANAVVYKSSKVITPSGDLWEFSLPIMSSLLLTAPSSYFLCHSDTLFYDEYIPALGSEEYIVPGNLYFVLPVKMLEAPLTGDDMAALAVRASNAVVKSRERDYNIGEGDEFTNNVLVSLLNVRTNKGRLVQDNSYKSKLRTIEE